MQQGFNPAVFLCKNSPQVHHTSISSSPLPIQKMRKLARREAIFLFNSYTPNYLGQVSGPAFQRPVYPAQMPSYNQFATPQINEYQPALTATPSGIQARFVSGREEAVAANVIPDGSIFIFADRAHGTLYTKQIDPQTGVADFKTYREVPSQPATQEPAPQYVTVDMLEALRAEMERRFESNHDYTKRNEQKGGERR